MLIGGARFLPVLPDCPEKTPDKCVFREEGYSTTCLAVSPPAYRRDGSLVGPEPKNPNTTFSTVICQTCGAEWSKSANADGVLFMRTKKS